MSSGKNEISERAQYLLKILVERHVAEGKPIGSRTLARESSIKLSPATIRNVMADLEDLGLIEAPHTSAGRIPTARGYRFFVDTLMSVQSLNAKEIENLKLSIQGDNPKKIMSTATDMLSGLTRMAGLVTLPKIEYAAWRHIEFISLSDTRVLAIMVSSDQDVQNRVIHTSRAYSPAELEQAANYLNQSFAGHTLSEVRKLLIGEMQETRETMDRMMMDAILMAQSVFEGTGREEDYLIGGETNLMTFNELSNVERLRELFEAFSQKQDILHILDQCQRAEGVQIFIGEEAGYRVFDGCSLVTAPYTVDEQVVGVLGVIGPTRMAYDRVVSVVDITAKILGSALNPKH
jgi:heat-inducible transcriptional repressor